MPELWPLRLCIVVQFCCGETEPLSPCVLSDSMTMTSVFYFNHRTQTRQYLPFEQLIKGQSKQSSPDHTLLLPSFANLWCTQDDEVDCLVSGVDVSSFVVSSTFLEDSSSFFSSSSSSLSAGMSTKCSSSSSPYKIKAAKNIQTEFREVHKCNCLQFNYTAIIMIDSWMGSLHLTFNI